MRSKCNCRFFLLTFFLLVLLPLAQPSVAQDRDSLLRIWEDPSYPDTQRLEAIRHLVTVVRRTNPDSSLQIAETMLDFARANGHMRWVLRAHTSKGISYAYLGDFPKALENFEQSKILAEEIGDPKEILGSIVNVGNIYYSQGDYSNALSNYEQGGAIAEAIQDTNKLIIIRNNLGSIYIQQGELSKALDYYQLNMALLKARGDQDGLADAYYNSAIVFMEQGKSLKALDYFQKSLQLRESLGDKYNITRVLGELGALYYDLQDFDKAFDYFTRFESMARELDDKDALSKAYDHLSSLYIAREDYEQALEYAKKSMELAEASGIKSVFASAYRKIADVYEHQGKEEEALKQYQAALDLYQALGESALIADIYANIGNIYLSEDNLTLAREWCFKAYQLGNTVGKITVVKDACACLAEAWEGLRNFEKAFAYQKQFIQLRDSLFDQEKTREITRMELNYAFEKEQLADSLAYAKERAAMEARLLRERAHRNLMLLGSLGVMILLGGVVFFYIRTRDHRQKMARKQEDLDRERKINEATSKFVPNEFLSTLGKERITEVTLGDFSEREVTVLFSDIRDYTTLAERMTPKENFHFLNALYGRIGPIIRKHRGFVNQYLGDAIMALFPESPADALNAANEMQNVLRAYNAERLATNKETIRLGIGLHTGPLVMGIIGDEKRMDAATISDTVNTASRIESLTKHYGASVLLSKDSLPRPPLPPRRGKEGQGLPPFGGGRGGLRFLGKVLVKGKQAPIGIYECIEGDAPQQRELKQQTLPDFEAGMRHYFSREFREASSSFQKILKVNPDDQGVRLFLGKSNRYQLKGVAEDWTGVETMEIK